MSISFEDGMKILALARQSVMGAKPSQASEPVAHRKSTLSDEDAHAFQVLMLATGQNGDYVGRGYAKYRGGKWDDVQQWTPEFGDPNQKPDPWVGGYHLAGDVGHKPSTEMHAGLAGAFAALGGAGLGVGQQKRAAMQHAQDVKNEQDFESESKRLDSIEAVKRQSPTPTPRNMN